jgi:cytoskeletal protein CcmA (bactofilin family)
MFNWYSIQHKITRPCIINANAVVNYDLCIPEGYNLHINGNSEIYGNIIAPNSSEIFINGTTIVDGKICAPNSILRVNGQATIEGPIYIYFLDMQNGSIGKE